jgi:hypothetical protein
MTTRTCQIERAALLRYWEENGVFPLLTTRKHLSECADCRAWQEQTMATINGIAVTLSMEEQTRLVATVLSRIAFLPVQKPPKPLWVDWVFPLALSSAVFGFAAAVLFYSYYHWLTRFSAFYFISATSNLSFASGIAVMWILAFSAAIWVAFALIRQRLPAGAFQNQRNEI